MNTKLRFGRIKNEITTMVSDVISHFLDNKVYKVYKNNYDSRIYLFTIKEHSNVFASGNNLYYISGNTIYKYDKYGLKKVLVDDELILSFLLTGLYNYFKINLEKRFNYEIRFS